jgi:hypothetical protein
MANGLAVSSISYTHLVIASHCLLFFSLSIESDDKVITMCVTCNVSALCLQSDQTLFSHRIASNALQREGHLFTFGEGHSSLEE